MRNWIILLNIISIKKGITQHNLDQGAALTLFKEIQALCWLNFVTGADLLWLLSPKIQQPNKCCMARTTSAQRVQAQSSTRKNTLPCQESLYFFFVCIVYCCNLDWVWMSLFISSMGLTKLIRAIYLPTNMVISLNGLSSRRIQEADSFPILIPPLFTSSLRTYLAQYLRQYILAH